MRARFSTVMSDLKNVCVIRLTTSSWKSGGQIHVKKTLRFLRRKSSGYNILDEDCDHVDVDGVVARITNINDVEDGVYKVVTCNEIEDWETGLIEDYSYKLVKNL